MPTDQEPPDPHRPPPAFRERVNLVVLVAAFALALLFLSWWLRWALALTFAAVLVGVFFHGGATLIQWASRRTIHRKFGHGSALAIFCLVLLFLVVGFGLVAAPSLAGQFDQLRDRLPESFDVLRDKAAQTRWGTWLLDNTPVDDLGAVVSRPEAILSRGLAWLGDVVTVLVAAVFLFFTGLYLAAEPGLYRRGVLWLLPPRDRKQADNALESVGRTLTYWLGGQLVSMTLIGVLNGLGLWALGIPLPLVLGVITALLTFIPNFGPIFATLLPLLLAFSVPGRFFHGGSLLVAVIVLHTAIQTVESYLITPMIQKRAVEMPPALLIFAQLVMGSLIGIVGVAVAAPLVAALTAASKELLIVGDTEKEDPKDRAHDG